jgi:hypothetical protein
MTEPVPIIAKAEAEPAFAAGMALLLELKPLARKAYEKTGEYKLLRMEICRRACALSLDPRAKAEAAQKYQIEKLKDGYLGGRPASVHSLFFDDLANTTGIARKTLRHWLGEWNEFAEALGIPLDEKEEVRVGKTPLQTLYEGSIPTRDRTPPRLYEGSVATRDRTSPPSITDWIEHVLEQSGHAVTPRDPPTPDLLAQHFVEQVEKFFTHKKADVLRTRAQKDAFAKRCNVLLRRKDLGWELMPHDRS